MFHPDLRTDPAQMIVRKGFNPEVDSYSAFFENDHVTPTGLGGSLTARGLKRLTMVGLATEYCVHFSAVDGAKLGFDVTVEKRLCRAIADDSLAEAMDGMAAAGVSVNG